MQKIQEMWVRSLGLGDPMEEEMATYLVFWPGVSHGQRSLVGYSPQGPKSWPQLSTHAFHPLPFLTIPFRSQDWCHLSGFPHVKS